MIIKQEAKEINEKIDISRRECTLSTNIQKLLLRQLKHELENENIYLTFSNYFNVRGLVVLAKYYELRSQEEKKHANWILHYLNQNDAEFVMPQIDQFKDKINDMIDPFDLTLDLEIKTTQMIYEIVDEAFDEHDYATYNWLMAHDPKTGMLVDEQVEEESISRTVYDIAKSKASWLRKEKSIMSAYKGNIEKEN